MSVTPTSIEKSNSSRLPKEMLPTMYDLPSEYPEELGLPDEYHDLQPDLLRYTLKSERVPPQRIFIGTDLNIYYDVNHPRWHKRPDWFVAINVPRLYEGTDLRRSYVVWQEEVAPLVVVELLSPGTAKEDLGEHAEIEEEEETATNGLQSEKSTVDPPSKWEVYESYLKVPHYIVFDRYTDTLRYFKWEESGYSEQKLNEAAPQIWIPELELGLGLWEGEFNDIPRLWLRWCDREGNWIPTPDEEAEAAEQRAEAAQQQAQEDRARAEAAQQQAEENRARAEAAQQQAEENRARAEAAQQRAEAAERAIAAAISRLLSLGLSIEQVAETLSLSVEEVNSRLSQ
jgi:Uma2 family endonuclease